MLLSTVEVAGLFPVRGYSVTNVTSRLKDDQREYTLSLSRAVDGLERTTQFLLPEPDEDGILQVGETSKVVIHSAKRGTGYELEPNSIKNLWIRSPSDVVLHMLRLVLHTTLDDLHTDDDLQQGIDSFFSTSSLTRRVDPDKPIDGEMAKDVILIDASGNSVDYRQRTYENWVGRLDLLTTPTGRFVGQLFRKAEGAVVDKGRLLPSDNLFSNPSKKYLLFPENNRPDRLLMTRSVLALHEEVVVPEQPLVAHESYDGRLKGIHLLTAVASWSFNYYDCIAISQQAADKLACKKTVRQVVIDNEPFELCVAEGQFVDPDDRLLQSEDKIVYATKLKTRSVLVRIVQTDTMVGRIPSTKYVFVFSAVYAMTQGDKLSSRYSTKGIARISDLPTIEVDGKQMELECLVHPRSFIGRRNLGALREMMANSKCLAEDTILRTKHFSDVWSMQQLVDEGYGELKDATFEGEVVGQVFCGLLYWLRTDKHAIDACSTVGEVKPVDQRGLNPDRGSSGQRLGPDLAIVMEAKGLCNTLSHLVTHSVEPSAVEQTKRILSCLH